MIFRFLFVAFGWLAALGLATGELTFSEDGTSDIWNQLGGVGIGILWLVVVTGMLIRRLDRSRYDSTF